jgi:hypothetical protein
MKVYTETNFLSNISNLISESFINNENLLIALLKLKAFLSTNDIKEIILLNKNNAIAYPEEVKQYITLNQQNKSINKTSQINIDNINFNYPFSYFLLPQYNVRISDKNKIQINDDTIEISCNKLFSDKTKNPKTDLKTWDRFVDSFDILPTNSIIVSDNFLFKNKRYNINELLLKILTNSNLKNEIDITLICGHDCSDNELEANWNNIYDSLNNKLKKFNLSIIRKQNKEYHDRHIFTDYQVFESGNSYSMYFNASTSLHCIPYSMDNQNNKTKFSHYYNCLLEIKSIISKVTDNDFKGNLSNKLIDNIQ